MKKKIGFIRSILLGVFVVLISLILIFVFIINRTINFDDFKIEVVIFENEEVPNSGYGYEIYLDGEIFIYQPHIPAVEGLYGFKNQEDAQKAAELVVEKIRAGIIPPTLSEKDLYDLGIDF